MRVGRKDRGERELELGGDLVVMVVIQAATLAIRPA